MRVVWDNHSFRRGGKGTVGNRVQSGDEWGGRHPVNIGDDTKCAGSDVGSGVGSEKVICWF